MAARKTPATTTATPKPRAKPAPKPATKRSPRKAAAPTTVAKARAFTQRVPKVSATTAWSIGAVLVAAGAGLAAYFTRGMITDAVKKATGTAEGHVPTDLLDPERNADDRAVADFRPDMDAIMSASEREALRPPVGKPSITASNGSMASVNAPLN
jgi:hypothetical protein